MTNDDNNNNVNNKRNSQTFKPLKARASALISYVEITPEEIISLYETAQDNLKTKMKTVYSNQDKINKRISNEKAVYEKYIINNRKNCKNQALK